MNWTDVRIFIEVARCGSMSQAATGLHMGQPAVSQRIRALEDEVGRSLFTRQHRGVILTPAGQTFLEYGQRSLSLLQEGITTVRHFSDERQHIRLASPTSLNSWFLGPLIRRLVERGNDVTLLDDHSHHVAQKVLDGSLDAGFVIGMPPFPGLHLKEIWQDPLVCVMAPTHPLASLCQQTICEPHQLAGHRIIWYRFAHFATEFRTNMERSIGARTMWIEATPADTVKQLILDNVGIGFLPRLVVQHELRTGALLQLTLPGLPYIAWRIQMLYRERKTIHPPLAQLLEIIEDLWPSCAMQ
ncbi:LysR family transcriptional regulator [Ferroacidibacillus organovorans]|uniref:LysR family transcriptional regulator n=1 Tax=Ferroacidibacillus organovorans TaxID=1765683 RepID=UPI0015C4A988|nr:LysR family transcriptional regulator [Ferroacidibacillus organovorans]